MHKLVLLCLLFASAVFAGPKDILVVQSYHSEYSWDQSYLKGLREGLGDEYTIHTFEMDTQRLPEESFAARAELAMQEYIRIDPALVILGDDAALNYLGPKLKNGRTPVVFLGINGDVSEMLNSGYENITGVLERPLYQEALMDLKKIVKPRPRKILILFDSGKTSAIAVEEGFQGQTTVKFGSLVAEARRIGDFDEWKQTVSNAKADGYQAIVVGLYHTLTDSYGSHIDSEKVLAWTAEASPLPLFAFWDFAVGKGKAIGGLVLFGKEQGLMAARLAKIVLKGVQPSSLKPLESAGKFVFSQSELDRWGFKIPNTIRYDALALD